MKVSTAVVSSLMLVPALALGQTPPPPTGVWTGEGQLGWLASQGNTESQSANALLDIARIQGKWKHAFHLGGMYSENTNVVAAERWDSLWQSNYDLTTDLYAFGALRYAHDLYSGFHEQASAAGGVGYRIFDTADVKLSVQLGAGYRRSRPQTLTRDASNVVVSRLVGASDGDAIATGGLEYSQALTSTTTLSDKLLIEAGSSNTLVTNTLALTVAMSDRLALSLGYNVQNNSAPPPGLKKRDTSQTANLVFSF
jgi:putative salt-induced outer membrane protein